jgi:hypothetical protein
MSLKFLFILMGLVSMSMIGAVIYTKVIQPTHISVAEVRAIDRLCQRQADDIMSRLLKKITFTTNDIKSEQFFYRQIHICLSKCRKYLVYSRSKDVAISTQNPLSIPKCLLDPELETLMNMHAGKHSRLRSNE